MLYRAIVGEKRTYSYIMSGLDNGMRLTLIMGFYTSMLIRDFIM